MFFSGMFMHVQCMRFSIFDWTHRESDDPYEQDPLGTCEATLAEIVAKGGEGQVRKRVDLIVRKYIIN